MAEHSKPNRKGRPRGSGSFPWRSFFQQTTTPLYVLGKGRRLRFANAAWEKLTGVKLADAIGMVCSTRRHSSLLAAALAPTPEAEAGKPDRSRRPAPIARSGPPWWDITFAPLAVEEGQFGIVGFITVVGEATPVARKVPPSIGALREKNAGHFTLDRFAGTSPAIVRFAAQLRHAATSTAPVWLVGEPGSGKETAARVIHHAGPHRDRAFVAFDCAGLQPYLIESVLFGHGGLLAGEHVGTLYLRAPDALPRDMQQRLADVCGEANAPRLISGSLNPAAKDVAGQKLVPEFHTALAVLELLVPPLRNRLPDLGRLAAEFLPGVTIEPAVFALLRGQPWKSNLRELAEVLTDAATVAKGPVLKVEHLPHEMRVRAGLEPLAVPPKPLTIDPILEAVEKRVIQLAMRKANGNQTRAAELLGVFRARLGRRLEALKLIEPPPGEG